MKKSNTYKSGKSIKKSLTYNWDAINIIEARYNIGHTYIRQILRGDRTPTFSDQLKREYAAVCTKINQTKEAIAKEALKTINNN